MSTRKINQTSQDEPKPALIRLKELPSDTHSDIMEILVTHTYKDAQPLVAELVGFACTTNVLFKFRQWLQMEEELDRDTDLLEQVEAYLKKRRGNWSAERIQKSALGFMMLQALSKRDPKAFSSVTRLWLRREQLALKEQKLELEGLKFDESRRKKLQMGLDILGKEFKNNPEAHKLYWEARQLLLPEQTEEDESTP